MTRMSQTSGFEAKALVDSRAFGHRPEGLESAEGQEFAAKAFGPEVRPGGAGQNILTETLCQNRSAAKRKYTCFFALLGGSLSRQAASYHSPCIIYTK